MKLDKKWLIDAFDHAAPRYDAAAKVQQEIRFRLLERLEFLLIQPHIIVDVGCGTGTLGRELQFRFPDAQMIGIDISSGMIKEAQKHSPNAQFLCADAMQIPLPDQSVDLLVSNLMLQWVDDFNAVFQEWARILKPNGTLLFTTFGPDTLYELQSSWAQVDGFDHVNHFIDLHTLGDGLAAAGFRHPVMDADRLTQTFPNVLNIMKHLKTIGAHNVNQGRSKGLLGKEKFQAVLRAYETYRQDDIYPVTYEVVYGYAQGVVIQELGTFPLKFQPR